MDTSNKTRTARGRPAYSLWWRGTAAGLASTGALLIGPSVPAAEAAPPSPPLSGPVEDYSRQAKHECLAEEPHRKGVWGLRSLLLEAYPGTTSGAIWAKCGTHSETSDHHAGRAFDWTVIDHEAQAEQAVDWLLATVDGTPHMRARRMGLYYIIWDDRIWSASKREWAPYLDCDEPGQDETACHRDHVHFSFGEDGADGRTSWWRAGSPGDPPDEPGSKKQPYSAKQVCGSGFRVIDRAPLGKKGTVFLLWEPRTRRNCVVTLKASDIGNRTRVASYLQPSGKKRIIDSGNFRFYSGPVRAYAPRCIRWGGSIGSDGPRYDSPWEHCSS